MTHVRRAQLLIALLLVMVPGIAGADDPQQKREKDSAWSIAIRFGGFSDNDRDAWWGPHAKYYYRAYDPQVTGAIDISLLFGRRSGITLSLEGLTFANDAVVMAPITVTYKYFLIGNGVNPDPGRKRPVVQPWIGGGGGLYTFVLDDRNIVRSRAGAQLSSGLLVPLGRHFDVIGELKYAVASDARILSYTMGFGVRF